MNKLLFALGAVALFASAAMLMTSSHDTQVDRELLTQWKNFKSSFNKKYSSPQEEAYRMQVFMDAVKFISENQGDTYTLGINQFADITNEEFRSTYLGYVAPEESSAENVMDLGDIQAPSSVNWVSAGVVPAILNQAQCGSCWAFSAAGAISMAYNVKAQNNNLQLSPEQLVQCSKAYGNNGCNGGLMDNAFRYAQKYPLATLAQYPYTSGNGVTGTCNTNLQSQGKYGVKTYTNVPAKNAAALQNAIALQPVSVAVDASNWQYYQTGIFSKCGTSLDHGVIAVGYTPTYWYVRNSWGTTWGMQGYIQLAAPGNTCGILQQASYPSV